MVATKLVKSEKEKDMILNEYFTYLVKRNNRLNTFGDVACVNVVQMEFQI